MDRYLTQWSNEIMDFDTEMVMRGLGMGKNKTSVSSSLREKDAAFASCVDELELGVDASIKAYLEIPFNAEQSEAEMTAKDVINLNRYRDRGFAMEMAKFENWHPEHDKALNIFPKAKTYSFAKMARRYMKKLAS